MDYIVYPRLGQADGFLLLQGDGVSYFLLTNTISDTDFLQWLRTQSSRVMLIAELKFGYQSSGAPAEGTIYLSDRPYVSEDGAPQPYKAVIEGAPVFERSIDVAKLGGRGTASLGSISLANADGNLDYLLTYILDGRDVAFYLGDPTWERAQFRQIGIGSVSAVRADDDTRISITLRDKGLLLDATIIGDAMTTGPNAGKPKPVLFGQVYNFDLTPYLFDTTGPTYYFNNYAQDSSLAFGNVLVRDAGVSLINTGLSGTTSDITVNAGTDTITKTAHGLLANDVIRLNQTAFGLSTLTQYWVISSGLTADNFKVSATRGGSAVDLSAASFTGTLVISSRRYYIDAAAASITLSSAPSGRVTADILSQGTSGDAAIQDVPHAGMRYIIDTWTRLTSVNRDTAAFTALVSAEQADGTQWGYAVLDRTNVLDILDEIAVVTNSWYSWDRTGLLTVGKLDLVNLDAATATATIVEGEISGDPSYENLPLPFGRLIVDANRNIVTQTDGLAGAVTAANRSLWSQDFQTRVKSTDADGLQYLNDWPTYHKTAIDSAPLETSYIGNAAQAFCDARFALFAPYTSVFTCVVGIDKYLIDIGDCVEVTYPRYSLSAGVNFRVASVKMRPAEKEIDLVLVRQNVPNWDALGVGTTVPGAPTIGTAVLGNTKATFAFTAPANNGGAAITSYTVTTTPGGFTASGSTSPLIVTGLSNGTPYTGTVHAANSVGNSAESSASNSVTPAATVPDAPTTVSAAVASSTSATVTFAAPADNGGSAILDYTATSSPGGLTSAAGASPRTVTGLTGGTEYTFTVTARNANGSSVASSASNSVSPGGRAVALTISASDTDGYNIFAAAGYPTDKVDVTVTINTGIDVSIVAGDSGYAMDTGSGWIAGSTITILNSGSIIGKGGIGGNNGSGGNPGVPAIFLRWDVIIDNSAGFIFGGGGGGGAGVSTGESTGGGGGGGAGYGAISDSSNGATAGGRTTGGSAGTAAYDGGAGGATATAGSPAPVFGGAGGAAGNAIALNGYTVTWLGGNDGPSGTHVKGAVS